MEIVNWCNGNAGFVSAMLTLTTIILSVIAIIVAINTARLPFKKALKLSFWWTVGFPDLNSKGIAVDAVNIGNRPVTIVMIGLFIDNKQFVNVNKAHGPSMLRPTETITMQYEMEELRIGLPKAGFNENNTVYVYAKDSEGKIFKKRIGKLKQLLQQINQ